MKKYKSLLKDYIFIEGNGTMNPVFPGTSCVNRLNLTNLIKPLTTL